MKMWLKRRYNVPLQEDKDIWREDLTEEEKIEAERKLREYLEEVNK